MNHVKADASKVKVIDCLYHKSYRSFPYPRVVLTINGEVTELQIPSKLIKDRTYYQKGVKCKVIMYGDLVIAYELKKHYDEESDDFEFTVERNMKTLITELKHDDWYFDGELFYRLGKSTGPIDGSMLGIIQQEIINPVHMGYEVGFSRVYNDAIGVYEHQQEYDHFSLIMQSPPLFIDLENRFYKTQPYFVSDDKQGYYLTLSALLRICHYISQMYGPEEIEVFDLPQYMVRHNTVNLPKLPTYVKENSMSYLKPYESVLYLLGKLKTETKLENILELKKLLKYVISYGVVNTKILESNNVFKVNQSEIPLIKVEV